jgi:hypothetical protein
MASGEQNSNFQDTRQVGCPVKLRINSKFQNLSSHSYILPCHTLQWFSTCLKQPDFHVLLQINFFINGQHPSSARPLPVRISMTNSYNYFVIWHAKLEWGSLRCLLHNHTRVSSFLVTNITWLERCNPYRREYKVTHTHTQVLCILNAHRWMNILCVSR